MKDGTKEITEPERPPLRAWTPHDEVVEQLVIRDRRIAELEKALKENDVWVQMTASAAHIEKERITALEEKLRVARALVDKLEVVHNDTVFMGVWQIAQLHFGPYKGASYADEFEAAKQALAQIGKDGAQ